MLVWGLSRVALRLLEGLFVVDFLFSHSPMGSLILSLAFRGDRLFVVVLLPGVTDSLLLTFCLSFMVSLHPVLVFQR